MIKLLVFALIGFTSVTCLSQSVKLTESIKHKQTEDAKKIAQLFENLNGLYFSQDVKTHLYNHLALLECNNSNHRILSSYYSLNNFNAENRYGGNNLFEEHDLLKDLTDNKIIDVSIDRSELLSPLRTSSLYNLTINISYESDRTIKNVIIHFLIQTSETMTVTVSDYDQYH
jgi:hypothetical protein